MHTHTCGCTYTHTHTHTHTHTLSHTYTHTYAEALHYFLLCGLCNYLLWALSTTCSVITDKRGIDGRLTSAQTALMMQEETIRRNERERKVLSDKVSTLERSVAAAESEKRQLQVCFL